MGNNDSSQGTAYSAEDLRTMSEDLLIDFAERVIRKTLFAYMVTPLEFATITPPLLFQLVVEQFYESPTNAYRLARLVLWYLDRTGMNDKTPEEIVKDADEMTASILASPRTNVQTLMP